jgi:hypothetical protein
MVRQRGLSISSRAVADASSQQGMAATQIRLDDEDASVNVTR